mgnify:FL=1
MENIIRVYDQNMKKLAYLQNAFNISYDLTLNELWFAKFTLPADDPKNIYCQPFNYVEIYDGKDRIELFRIMSSELTRAEQGTIIYQCEHVLATLLDDVMYQYHQIGGGSIGTVQALRYILDRQLTPHWQLQQCDFDRRFEYKWENENLLAALFSVPKPFDEKYRWEFDTTGTIWRISLKRLPTKFRADIMYRKNMLRIQKEVDPTTIVTRLYCLGYGEGDNQLDIRSVNGGIPYLEANTTTWGIKSSILVDRRFESPETLKAYGQTVLNELKNPYKTYSVQAIDLYRKSPEKYERFFPGDIVRIVDKEDGITEDLPIVKVSKSDVTGNPGAVSIEIANKSRDITGSISALQERARINDTYAQGATNQMIVPYADNADPSNPATLRFYIPDTLVRINKCILNYRLEPFRAYSKAIGGGGGAMTTTEAGGASVATSRSAPAGLTQIRIYPQVSYGTGFALETSYQSDHNHGIPGGTGLATTTEGAVWFTPSGGHSHMMPRHGHEVMVSGEDSHNHQVNLPNHEHTIVLPSHSHALEFGIYQGETADSVSIKVDGKAIPQTKPDEDIDIIKHLSVDSAGKIQRNTWHEIEITPGAMSRIVANIYLQIFTNSRGGEDL